MAKKKLKKRKISKPKKAKKHWPQGKPKAVYAYVSGAVHAYAKRQKNMSAYVERLIIADMKLHPKRKVARKHK